jgi:hypothetical protein
MQFGFGIPIDGLIITPADQVLYSGNINASFYGFAINGNYTLLHSNDFVSLSVDPTLNIALNFINTGWGTAATQWMVRLPTYLMFKIGLKATPFNNQMLGAGIGVGINPGYYRIPQEPGIPAVLGFLYNPTICAQFGIRSFRNSTNATFFRFYLDLTQSALKVPVSNFRDQDIPSRATMFGLTILIFLASF